MALHDASVKHPEKFWAEAAKEIHWDTKPSKVKKFYWFSTPTHDLPWIPAASGGSDCDGSCRGWGVLVL